MSQVTFIFLVIYIAITLNWNLENKRMFLTNLFRSCILFLLQTVFVVVQNTVRIKFRVEKVGSSKYKLMQC